MARREGRVSQHFAWTETAVSASFPHLAIDVPAQFEANAVRLAHGVLEVIRADLARPMRVLSWYRSGTLNRQLRGSPTSQHMTASACDWTTDRLREAWLSIIRLVQVDAFTDGGQMIYYPSRGFIHVALKSDRFKVPTLCVHWPERGMRYRRHAASAEAFAALLPEANDPQRTVTP